MKIINTDSKFGYEGPFEADSFDALADEMMPTLREWAQDKIDTFDDAVFHGEADGEDRPDPATLVDILRDEFIDALEEVSPDF